jgi:hypothetical protein
MVIAPHDRGLAVHRKRRNLDTILHEPELHEDANLSSSPCISAIFAGVFSVVIRRWNASAQGETSPSNWMAGWRFGFGE